MDDHMLDGTQNVAITAAALGNSSGTNFITIFDNETATLTLTLPASADRGDGQVQGERHFQLPRSQGCFGKPCFQRRSHLPAAVHPA